MRSTRTTGLDVGQGIRLGIRGFGADAEKVLVDELKNSAALFFRVAMGKEFGIDVGSASPLPEEFVELLLRLCLKEGNALLFEIKAAGDEFTAPESHDVGEELADLTEFKVGIVAEGGSLGRGGEAHEEVMDEIVEEHCVVGGRTGRARIGGLGSKLEGGLAHFPKFESVMAIVGKVLGIDRFAVEVLLEDGFDFGLGIEPFDGLCAGGAIVEAEVELLADWRGEMEDFAGHDFGG